MASVFVKRYPSKGELPKCASDYITNKGLKTYYPKATLFFDDIEYWLEEIELPSDEEVLEQFPTYNSSGTRLDINVGRQDGAYFIFKKLA